MRQLNANTICFKQIAMYSYCAVRLKNRFQPQRKECSRCLNELVVGCVETHALSLFSVLIMQEAAAYDYM